MADENNEMTKAKCRKKSENQSTNYEKACRAQVFRNSSFVIPFDI